MSVPSPAFHVRFLTFKKGLISFRAFIIRYFSSLEDLGQKILTPSPVTPGDLALIREPFHVQLLAGAATTRCVVQS